MGTVPIAAIFWSALLIVPLSALFSAISLAIGAYARSSKEGQHYLMPLFLVTMPLIFLTLAPGVELSPFYSLVPVTGVALLMQKLMTAATIDQVPWLYFLPVLAPIALYSALALRWAIDQFQREEVLFREAERLDVRLWVLSLFRDKPAMPSAGQAVFCFGLIVMLRWLTMGFAAAMPMAVHTGISLVALVAAPALFMALLLTTRPREGLALKWPRPQEVGLAAILAVLLLPPLATLATTVFTQFPHLTKLLEDRQPLMRDLRSFLEGTGGTNDLLTTRLLVFAILPALCEELAFRGFILAGLLRRFRPRTAILLCSFLFALFHMNVFQFLPAFFLGVILGLLTVRSRSLVPAIMFHGLHNSVLILATACDRTVWSDLFYGVWPIFVLVCLGVAVGLLWWLYRKPYVAMKRKAAHQVEHASKALTAVPAVSPLSQPISRQPTSSA
jgi:sodium transport system permease protein